MIVINNNFPHYFFVVGVFFCVVLVQTSLLAQSFCLKGQQATGKIDFGVSVGFFGDKNLVRPNRLNAWRSITRKHVEQTGQGNENTDEADDSEEKYTIGEASRLKKQLYQLAASYDRGFGATTKARNEANDIFQQLAVINPSNDAARGIDGGENANDVPLRAIWRMVWTSALDVVSLGASPIAAPSAIYQVIENPPIAINIIDFIPRAQTFFPPSIAPPSLLRAEVTTRASSRNGKPNRVGLVFEGVKLKPVEIFGQKVEDKLPSLSVDFTWPRNILAPFVPGINDMESGQDNADALGYFDVEYLDDELLVIRQQAPGGVFALVKVDNYDP